MNTDSNPIHPSILLEGDLTEAILGAAFKVLNTLGAGFLEKVYENALALELRKAGLVVECQRPSPFGTKGRQLATIWRTWWWQAK
jgi:GxxExxY protein